jgi:predicted transcriptional regulator
MSKIAFADTELREIRAACARGLADLAAGRHEPDSDELFQRIDRDVNQLLEVERLHRER